MGKKEQKAERNLKKFLGTADNVLSFYKMLKLNKLIKQQQTRLKTLRELTTHNMSAAHVDRLAAEVGGQVFVVTLSDGGKASHRFNLERFKKDNPELYKKYLDWQGYTPCQLTIRTYKEPKSPCMSCKLHGAQCLGSCKKHDEWIVKKEGVKNLVDSINEGMKR